MVLSLGLLVAFLPLLGICTFYRPIYTVHTTASVTQTTEVIQNVEADIEANNETNNQNESLEAVASTNENTEAPKETQARPETVPLTSRSGSRDVKVIKGERIDYNFTEEEIEILERIVEAEVTGNSYYEGKLAVANVILNRIESPRFPNTVKGVVFAQNQFTPTKDGRYYTVKVTELTKQVVADAINGARAVPDDAYYFCTPRAGKGWFETALRKIDYVAPHNIYGYK